MRQRTVERIAVASYWALVIAAIVWPIMLALFGVFVVVLWWWLGVSFND